MAGLRRHRNFGRDLEPHFAILMQERKESPACLHGFPSTYSCAPREMIIPEPIQRRRSSPEIFQISLANGAALLAGKSDVIFGADA